LTTPTADVPDLLATATIADPAGLAAAVATLVSRTADVLHALPATPSRR
jgi:hypothetical protein